MSAPTQNLTSDEALALQAVELAKELLATAQAQQTRDERAQASKIARMMKDADGKKFTMLMPDQAFRSHHAQRIASQIRYLLDQYGTPRYFTQVEQLALGVGGWFSQYLPNVVVPLIVAQLRQQTNNVILPSEPKQFFPYLTERKKVGIRLNINQLGEAILGEAEAENRLNAYLQLLANPQVEYISVKISSVFSQIHLVAFEQTVEQIKNRLRLLYRQAMHTPYRRADGTTLYKFINLDMEEYRDLHLTVSAFQQVLDEAEFKSLRAGIVLQAYLPDSFVVQQSLTEWAMRRVANGGASIKLRIVKGANLAMERVEAALHGWEQAPYLSKHEVDANYKRMVTYGCQPERAQAVQLGIASHNLFDVAYALVLRDRYGLHEWLEFEMLEGMANHQARAVKGQAGGMLLYAPVVKQSDFHSAIAYLVRRLDENTSEENFLHDLFSLTVDSPAWESQRNRFLHAVRDMHHISDQPNRQQNRQTERVRFSVEEPFYNVADTDFSLRANQLWIQTVLERWNAPHFETLPLQVMGALIQSEAVAEGHSPAHPHQVAYHYSLAQPEEIERAIHTAVSAQVSWQATPIAQRKALLVECANKLAAYRGDLIGAMALDGGKTAEQADPEVSEAIDFANYYARSLDLVETELTDLDDQPLGVVLITPPWNFPLAIPCGGTLAALMAGNAVLFKPAPEAVLVGWAMVNALWDAGIPREALQFVPTTDDAVGQSLVTDARVNAVILTGAYETARMFLHWKPTLRLFAETSGKNAMIISAMSDRDQAIKDLVKSAFGHAGQKCSAASLAILEAEVYDDAVFRRQLKDAVQSLHVGSPFDLSSVIAPVVREPEGKLRQALTQLEEGETWLLQPQNDPTNPNLWTPAIKLGVQAGSFFHQTECFGPVLGLMRAKNLEHAIELANGVDYALTSGIHTLDEREIALWKERIHAGNAYINRVTTGAIVQRQPFGGWKRSAFGYAKAGGVNYVLSLATWTDKQPRSLAEVRQSYQHAWDSHFRLEHDPSQVLGESNIFRYRPLKRVVVRVTAQTRPFDLERVALATAICGIPLRLSHPQDALLPHSLTDYAHITLVEEDEAGLLQALQEPAYRYWQRVRVLGAVSETLREACIETHTPLIDAPIVSNGRLELRHYLLEQAISQTLHRYGNLLS
ncbi:MAG: bifunctional proline dehydrogenase/L-glutamate gamma-semialdehyde dehydrogenase [Phototrophicaceae bacterium]